VKEVHTWSEKSGATRTKLPDGGRSVPAGFNWDLWLGVAGRGVHQRRLPSEQLAQAAWTSGQRRFWDMGLPTFWIRCSARCNWASLSRCGVRERLRWRELGAEHADPVRVSGDGLYGGEGGAGDLV